MSIEQEQFRSRTQKLDEAVMKIFAIGVLVIASYAAIDIRTHGPVSEKIDEGVGKITNLVSHN